MNILRYFKPSKHSKLLIVLFASLAISILIVSGIVNNQETFWDSFLGALMGLIGALIIYELNLHIKEIDDEVVNKENTKFVYDLYKIEIETNRSHLNNLKSKRWVPFYRLQTNTRDKLWGELANYSKDISLLQRINTLYGEYDLINRKIDIMNAVRLQLSIRPKEDDLQSGEVLPDDVNQLNEELKSQLDGCIGLGEGANKIADGCLEIMKNHLEDIKI